MKKLTAFYCILLIPVCLNFSCTKTDFGHAQPDWEKPFKVSFTIYEPFYGSVRKFATDTIFLTKGVVLSSDNYFDSCKWIVGDDPRIRTQRTLSVSFSAAEAGQTISVTLIAYWYDKTDTVRKHFTVMGLKKFDDNRTSYTIDPPYVGKFSGSFQDDPAHKFEVTIANFGPYPSQWNAAINWDFRIFNLPEGCGGAGEGTNSCKVDTISPFRYSYTFETTYKAFHVNTSDVSTCCPPAVMYGYMDSVNPNKIIIEYSQMKYTNTLQLITLPERKFVGYRQ